MFRTLLVDDDYLVRSYLKTLDCWRRAGYEIIRDVQDGEEALQAWQEEKPDVVITDISMPVLDGIALIRKIRESDSGVYILVLSCHDEFEYVKEAMKLGADEYILKNALDENTLYEALEKSGKQIKNRLEKSSSQAHTRKLIRMGSHTLKYHFFNSLLSGTLEDTQREERRKEAGITGSFANSAVISMVMQQWGERQQVWSPLEAEAYSQTFRHGLMQQMEELLGADSEYAEIIYLGAGVFCCFLDLSSMGRNSAMHQRLTNTASVCFRYCQKEAYTYGIGVSSICFGENGIRQAYQQVREMMKLSFYEERDILYFDTQKPVSGTLPKAAEELYERIENMKNSGRLWELEELWGKVLEESKELRTEGRLLIQWLRRLDKKAGIPREPLCYGGIWNIRQLEEIAKGYGEALLKAQGEIPPGVSGAVRCAAEFICKNYKNPIGLQDAAEAAGVNAAYLSYLFKQEMKIGFSNYLQDKRLKCAAGLLQSSRCKIKEAAKESGFCDYHYFAKTFKKAYGKSPAEFRKEQESQMQE